MTRREFGAGMLAGAAAEAAGRPNIVFLCADQHSGPVLGAMGHYAVRTPNLDRLAGMGVMFRNAYSGNPVCVPARASMMTGRFASDAGSFCNSTPLGRVPSWGNALRGAGYDCWATGKLDLTAGADYGFREVNTTHEHSRSPDITSLFRAPVPYRAGERASVDGEFTGRPEHHDADLARAAVEFLRSRRPGPPWAAYVGMTLPHPKWVARARYRDLYPPASMRMPAIPPGYLEQRHTMFQVRANFANIQLPVPEERVRLARAAYYAMITELDEYVGRVIEQVDLGNTLLVYTSDHGEMLGDNGLWLKNVLLEGAARVPLILAGAGLPRGKVVDTPVAHVDLVATILDMAGAARSRELRGHSLAPLARGEAGDHPGFAYSESHSEGNCTGSFMIRRGDWKYLYFTGDEPLLFNLREDPGEFRNLAGAALQKELHGILTGLVDPDGVTERAFAAQERVLSALVRRSTPEEFYKAIVGRLGPAQARVLTIRHYRKHAG
jgi:choline-sulfatase